MNVYFFIISSMLFLGSKFMDRVVSGALWFRWFWYDHICLFFSFFLARCNVRFWLTEFWCAAYLIIRSVISLKQNGSWYLRLFPAFRTLKLIYNVKLKNFGCPNSLSSLSDPSLRVWSLAFVFCFVYWWWSHPGIPFQHHPWSSFCKLPLWFYYLFSFILFDDT